MYPYNYPKGEISMLNQNYTAKLLNLEDVIITNVENIFERKLQVQVGHVHGRT